MYTAVGGVVPQDRWQPPQRAKVCQYQDCGASFHFFSTKANCYRCGIVLCSKCAATKAVIPRYYNDEAVPLCPRCHQVVERYKARGSPTPGYIVHSTTVSTTPARPSPVPPLASTPPPESQAPLHDAPTALTPSAFVPHDDIARPTTTSISDTDLHALQGVIETLQTSLLHEQSKCTDLLRVKEENDSFKDTNQLLQQRLNSATQQRAELEAQVARLAAERDEAHQQLTANAEELQHRLNSATQQRAELEAQVARLAAERDEAHQQLTANAEELQQRLNSATQQRAELEAQVARLAAERDEAHQQLTANAEELQRRGVDTSRERELEERLHVMVRRCIALEGEAEQRAEERDNALRYAAELQQEVPHADLSEEEEKAVGGDWSGAADGQLCCETTAEKGEDMETRSERPAASGEETMLLCNVACEERDAAQNRCTALETQVASLMRDRDDAVQERHMAYQRCAELEEQKAVMASELQAVKTRLLQALKKASSLMARLSASYGDSPVNSRNSSASFTGAGGVCALPDAGGRAAVPQAAPYMDAEFIDDVEERDRERGKVRRRLARGLRLRERARPLEQVLADELLDNHQTSDAEEVTTKATAFRWSTADLRRLDAREAQLDERAARLKEKERQLLRVTHELQARSRALQLLHVRAGDRPHATPLPLTSGGSDTSHTTPQKQHQGTRAPFRMPLYQPDSGVPPYQRAAGAAMSKDRASPLPREPPRARMVHRDGSGAIGEATSTDDTQERLTAATEAYRDVLYNHILESNGLQGADTLAPHLPAHPSGDEPKKPGIPSKDIISKTRAMLRALEARLGASRGTVRGVDPAVQERSLEAFRRLEVALSALCGGSEA